MPPAVSGHSRSQTRSAQVLQAIETYLRRHDRSPTVRDLCHATGIPSTSYMFFLLAKLELDGYITREPGVSRSIRLTRPRGVPIVGAIAASCEPLDLFDLADVETLDITVHARGGRGGTADDVYAFRVKGDSMIKDGIFEGDYVLVRPGPDAPEGAIVVAVHLVQQASGRGAATIKRLRFDRKRHYVLLCPENDTMEPIEIPMKVWKREWAIHGTVTGVYRPCSPSGQPRPRPHRPRLRAS